MPIAPAHLEKPGGAEPPFIPFAEYLARAADFDYIVEEWFATGMDEHGRSYKTQVVIRRPRDPARFSGTVIVESLHIHRIAPLYMYCTPYILRSGHAWACVVSQKTALDVHVKPTAPDHYASLHIGANPAPPPPGAPADLVTPPFKDNDKQLRLAWLNELARFNDASPTILAQVGAALRQPTGPLAGYGVRHLVLGGHSQTGFVTTNYFLNAHATQRLADGAPIYDGLFPSGFPANAFGPCDVPIVQLMSDGDVSNPNFTFQPGYEGRKYRRPDNDASGDRFRLYELAGVSHAGTRHPAVSDPHMWQDVATAIPIPLDSKMNSLPHHELFSMALDHLIRWVAEGKTPPRAPRIDVGTDGFFAKDEHGNSTGGVRCVQLDVPRAKYYPNPLLADGTPSYGTVATEEAFDSAKMQKLYGTPAQYVARFNARLDELISQGWFLAGDAEGMRAEAQAQQW
jgi:hypothetical protein